MEKQKIYTNLADSVVYAGFRASHQYSLKRSYDSNLTLSDLCKKELDSLLQRIDENENTVLYVTLNQICDNRYLLLEKQKYHFELLRKLIETRKLKISTYLIDPNNPSSPKHTLISYTEQSLLRCLNRLCKGVNSPDLVYISSLFPHLLESSNPDIAHRAAITSLLGYFPTGIYYDEKNDVYYQGKKQFTVDHFLERDYSKFGYGLYTALKKFDKNNPFNESNINVEVGVDISLIVNWLKNLFEIDRIAQECDAYEMNANPGIRLNSVIQSILIEEKELNKRLDIWLGDIYQKKIVKDKIFEILSELSSYKNRTDMYIHIRDIMEDHLKDADISCGGYTLRSFFDTSDKHKMQFKKVLFPIQSTIDWAYNILNTMLSVDECRILEYSFGIADNTYNGNSYFYFTNFQLLEEQTYKEFLPVTNEN
ncbi:MAG: hypothetical protein II059_10975 [Clostridia bacterium]|nr:hypothetical protein [Clostridia bacterium]